MASAIGSAALVLSTNATKLYSGLKEAVSKSVGMVKSMKDRVSGMMGGMFGSGIKFAAGMALFNAAAGAVTGAITKFKELKDSIDASSKAARRLGMDTQTFQGLEHAASLSGVKSEQLSEALNKLRTKVAGPLDEALYDLADRYQALSDPLEKAKLLTSQFGETGLKLSSMFEGGKEGLKGMVDEAKALGFALSDKDAALIESANDSMERAKKALQGLWQQIIVVLAPAFEFWGKIIQKVASKLGPVFSFISQALKAFYEVAAAVIEVIIGLIEEAIVVVGQWMEAIFGAADQWPTVGEVVTGALRMIGKAAAYAFDTIMVGIGAVTVAIGFLTEHVLTRLIWAFHQVAKLAKTIPDSIKPSWVNGFVDGIGRAEAAVKSGGKNMQQWGKNQIAGFGNSAKAVDTFFDGLGKKRVADIKKEAAAILDIASAATPEYKAVGSILEGSKEAYSIEARFKTEGLFTKDKEQKQLEEQRKANALLKQISDGIGQIKLPTFGII